MHRNKAAWKTSAVVCEKLESIFKMHARLNFSLLLCHCFEKSKLCLQKLNICIPMYESIQLSREETAEHNSGFGLEKEAEAKSKIHFLTQVEWRVIPAYPSQGPSHRLMRRGKGASTFLLNPSLFPHSFGPGCLCLSPWLMASQPGLLPTSGFQMG